MCVIINTCIIYIYIPIKEKGEEKEHVTVNTCANVSTGVSNDTVIICFSDRVCVDLKRNPEKHVITETIIVLIIHRRNGQCALYTHTYI